MLQVRQGHSLEIFLAAKAHDIIEYEYPLDRIERPGLKPDPVDDEIRYHVQQLMTGARVGADRHEKFGRTHKKRRQVQRPARDGEFYRVTFLLDSPAVVLQALQYERRQSVFGGVGFC